MKVSSNIEVCFEAEFWLVFKTKKEDKVTLTSKPGYYIVSVPV